MALAMNVIMAVFAAMSLIFGISFFMREKEVGRIRWFIFIMGIACCLSNLGYMLMSLTPIGPLTLFYRDVGFIGVDLYLFSELLLVLHMIESKRHQYIKVVLIVFYSIFTVVACSVHGVPGDVIFISNNGFTEFVNQFKIGYTLQSALSATYFVGLFPAALIWIRQQKTKRGRSFVFLCIISNFVFLFSSFPYFFGMKTTHPGFFYCLGEMLAFTVMWYAGTSFSGFSVTAAHLTNDIFSSINVGLLIFTPAGELIIRNEFARKELNIPTPKKQTLTDIFDIPKDVAKEILSAVRAHGSFVCKMNLKNSDAKYSVSFSIKQDVFNEALCIFAAAYDITREEEMISEVMAANDAKSTFLANMSHEIRTPINAILGMNDMIIRESNESDIVGYAMDVASSGNMLLSLVNDILDFSKISSGKMEIVPVCYDLSSLVNDVINMVNVRAEDKGLEFVVNVDKNLPYLLIGDEIRVKQIITNLVTNGIKYTDRGSVKLTLTGGKVEQGFELRIIVSDTGKGIKEEDQQKLFESFTRLDMVENRSIEGTGLGLSLTRSFAEMMGGTLTLESSYGVGSIFTVKIIQEVQDETPVGDFNSRIKNKTIEKNKFVSDLYAPDARVLVVDDVIMNCKVFCGYLKNSGIKIDMANSGFEALDMCEVNKYDLIFMDHRMPKMDGVECFHYLRNRRGLNYDTPVIVLTANAISGMREEYLNEGFNDYLSKPIDSEKLEAAIKEQLPDLLRERPVNEAATAEPEESIKVSDEAATGAAAEEETKTAEDAADTANKTGIAAEFPMLDTAVGMKYCMNDEEFYREMIVAYLDEDRSTLLEESFAAGNMNDVRTYAHAVKSTSLNIGATEISERAKALELAAKNNDKEFVTANLAEFVKDYRELLASLKR